MQTTMKTADRESGRSSAKTMLMRDMKLPDIIPVAICFGLVFWLYTAVFKNWYDTWMAKESYYSHGVLVPFICLFIIWLKRKSLLQTRVAPAAAGYWLLVPSLLVFMVLTWAGGMNLQGLVFPVLIAGMVLVLFGREIGRILRFPVGYLFFMCVLPGDILTKLSFRIQMISTACATMMLRTVGLDASREGAAIHLPNIEVMVGTPCSGFRMLISLFAFAVLLAYLKEGPAWGRASLVVVTLPLSILLNSFRVMMIAMVGEFFGESAMHGFHDYSGYIVLALAFVALSLFARLVKCQKFNSILMP
jgi:exosortase